MTNSTAGPQAAVIAEPKEAPADPAHRSLYLAAAAYLSAWWAQLPMDDPLLS